MELDVAILGAGAAGMMAAVACGERSGGTLKIAIFEKNERPGIKVLVCGGGRCNFTNAGPVEFLIEQFGRNGRFLTPALRHLDNDGLRDFFKKLGVPSHVETRGGVGGKVYPDSNQAKSVVDALVRRMREVGVEVFCGAGSAVKGVKRRETNDERRKGEGFEIETVDGRVFAARAVVLAVGGMSYQRMGTVGDGYRIAESLGHRVVTPRPAIVGLLVAEEWAKELKGLAVRDVEVRIVVEGEIPRLATGKPTPSVGDMLFTHFGLSGPAVLNGSEVAAELLEKLGKVGLKIDFARHVSHEEAHGILRGWQQHSEFAKKRLRTMLAWGRGEEKIITSTSPDMTAVEGEEVRKGLSLPVRLAEMVCTVEGIDGDQACATLTGGQMHKLVERIKGCRFAVTGTRGFKEAMVTAGGVKLSEVDPKTMASKMVPGLYLTGEVLDLTGPSGGYNLQLAFSTGHLAGCAVAEKMTETSHK